MGHMSIFRGELVFGAVGTWETYYTDLPQRRFSDSQTHYFSSLLLSLEDPAKHRSKPPTPSFGLVRSAQTTSGVLFTNLEGIHGHLGHIGCDPDVLISES
jgi:hypothetical protein